MQMSDYLSLTAFSNMMPGSLSLTNAMGNLSLTDSRLSFLPNSAILIFQSCTGYLQASQILHTSGLLFVEYLPNLDISGLLFEYLLNLDISGL